MKTGLIYKLTSKTSRKCYIGQCKTSNLSERMESHKYETSKTDIHFGRALRKYGWEDFNLTILEENINYDDIDEREIYWIKYYDSFNNGYNSTIGGKGGNTYAKKTEEEMKIIGQKISKAISGSKNGNKGQYVGKLNSMYGKHHTEETKRTISKKLKGRKLTEEDKLKKSLAQKGVPKKYTNPNKRLYLIDNKGSYEKLIAREIKELLNLENFIELKNIIDNNIEVNGYKVVESVETIESRL